MQGTPTVAIKQAGETWLDRAIGLVSPQWAVKRARARLVLDKTRRYEGAGKGRRTESWRTLVDGPNESSGVVLQTLRARSRDLVRNNPYAARAVAAISNNTIGKGIRPQWQRGAKQIAKIQDIWSAWGETSACDAAGKMDFYGLQNLVMRSVVEGGEALVIRVRDASNSPIPFKIRVTEPDFIDDFKNNDANPHIVQGVEIDGNGAVVALWLYSDHPGERARSVVSARVPIDDIAHIYRVDRPGQLRGVPWSAPVMIRIRDFDDYEDAFLFRQKLANCHTAFIYDSNPDSDYAGVLAEKLEPGAIEIIPPGKDIKFNDPPRADGNEDFRLHNLRAQAIGWGITYDMMTGDYSRFNFSSGRMGHIEIGRNIASWQCNMLLPQLCERVERWFLEGLALTGISTRNLGASWTLPRREMVSPQHEIPPIRDAVRSAFMSPQQGIGQMGFDPQTVMDEWVEWAAKMDENAMTFDIDPRKTKPGKMAEPEPPDDDDEER